MIIGEIRRYLRDNNSIRVSRSVRDTAYKALSAKERLTAVNADLLQHRQVYAHKRDEALLRISRWLREHSFPSNSNTSLPFSYSLAPSSVWPPIFHSVNAGKSIPQCPPHPPLSMTPWWRVEHTPYPNCITSRTGRSVCETEMTKDTPNCDGRGTR